MASTSSNSSEDEGGRGLGLPLFHTCRGIFAARTVGSKDPAVRSERGLMYIASAATQLESTSCA